MIPSLLASAALLQALGASPSPTSIDGVRGVILARAFTLDDPATWAWSSEHPAFDSGTLLLLDVDPELLKPRQVGVPLLMAGDLPVERASLGWPSGHLLVVVPSSVDVRKVPFYFGSTELPERTDHQRGGQELQAALAAGARPLGYDAWTRAFLDGGAPLHLKNMDALYHQMAPLIETWAPEEQDTARLYRSLGVSRP